MPSAPLLLYTRPDSGELFRRRWALHVVEGSDRGTSVDVQETPALIGAAPAATLVLVDDTVSRYHAELDVFAEGLRLRDLDSTNGTFLDSDLRIRDAFVENGGVFRVGRTTIRLIAMDEPAASEIETDPHGIEPGAVERFEGMVGVSAASRELFRMVRKVAPSSSAVLFEGEIGTGKSALARAVHDLGPRRDQPFVTVDLERGGALELEEVMFGAAAAAPSASPTPGAIERANLGTLYLRHADRVPRELQRRLRSVIERGEIHRLGEDRRHRVDVRLVASAEQPLAQVAGYDRVLARRLSVVHLPVKPLRSRAEDARVIAEDWLKAQREPLRLGPRTAELLATQRWPGNARELFDTLLRVIGLQRAPHRPFETVLRRAFLYDLMVEHRGHVSHAAAALGTAPPGLFRALSDLDVELDDL